MRAVEFVVEGKGLDVRTPDIGSIAKKHGVGYRYVKHQLSVGIGVEKEHTSDVEIAREIALDHLNERPDYYVMLTKMEKGHD